MTKVIQEMILAVMTTPLKLLARFLAIRVGKMMRLEISKAPRSRIPKTTTIEQMIEKMVS